VADPEIQRGRVRQHTARWRSGRRGGERGVLRRQIQETQDRELFSHPVLLRGPSIAIASLAGNFHAHCREDRMTLRELATGLRFPEGPVAMDDGSVIVVE